MGRYLGPRNKIARRFGVNLGLKTNPVKVARRLSQPPGAHGQKKRRGAGTSYGRQLIEKQKAKYMYGMREAQFRRYVAEATRRRGDSSVYLQQLLEMRLDNVVYRLGLAGTRAQARQMVNHSLFLVNQKSINIPSHIVRVGDVITIKASKLKKKLFTDVSERLAKANLPSWLAADPVQKSGKVTSAPGPRDFDRVFDVKLIIEYYSSR